MHTACMFVKETLLQNNKMAAASIKTLVCFGHMQHVAKENLRCHSILFLSTCIQILDSAAVKMQNPVGRGRGRGGAARGRPAARRGMQGIVGVPPVQQPAHNRPLPIANNELPPRVLCIKNVAMPGQTIVDDQGNLVGVGA